jgi:hypothetical protein
MLQAGPLVFGEEVLVELEVVHEVRTRGGTKEAGEIGRSSAKGKIIFLRKKMKIWR